MSAIEEIDALKKFYPEILALMPDVFDSHQFILKLAQKYQSAYIKALHEYVDDDAPFAKVHAQISKSLHGYAEYIGMGHSPNIFGDSNENAVWRKRG